MLFQLNIFCEHLSSQNIFTIILTYFDTLTELLFEIWRKWRTWRTFLKPSIKIQKVIGGFKTLRHLRQVRQQ